MLSSLISFYITAALQPLLPLPTNENIPIIEEASINIGKLDFLDLLSVSPIPIKKDGYISPVINAHSSVAIDNQTGEILFEKDLHTKRQIASITKLMTAIIILEENDLDSIVTVSPEVKYADGSEMFLHTGEQITVENLMYGLIINSANDAAVALAEFNAGSVEAFVEKMNKKALSLGLLDTHFQNPIGYDNSHNYSSAYDVAIMARYVYQKPFVKKAAAIKELEVTSVDNAYTHKLESTNELLDSYLNIKGLKTGHTDQAGLCLVAIAENENQNDIISVVLNSPARFTESKILIDWIFRAYIW
ncbi:D-alanyl-D-alanine carboxypeptidase [Candidatus Peregrinibacteria bacterium]|jgi:serine-type D-Ala-D-Ala carboxypeptidase (penicillin-binding protein 5/6)|nr:D-alanyl-D-alanine carboxypeptidase [Candidatus Peregrinibacteria bacterium]MBT4148106.1 D-alanyl-D-alanine carboxypeptidase [Candidatus Peregrinibacteria bacterium]MBT4366354.1 D-alanyl-D-alanine carboxypeptidase [Candidatus Peregrinibacteria bacterium]MBT4456440.1 D-alanyl-D-alanine carboxypeptidase [Candidatus Peregrinibacteria bacterium]